MSFLKNGFILGAFTLLGLCVAGYVSFDYWWNTSIKPSPEYQLIAVLDAFEQCDKPQFAKAIDLNQVLYGIGEQQVQAELKKRTVLTKHLVNSALIAPFIRKKIHSTVTTIEQEMMACSATNKQTHRLPFWLMPSVQSLVMFKTVLGITTIEEPRMIETQQGKEATFLLSFISSKPKALEATIQLKKRADPNQQWQITHVQLSDELIGLMNSFTPKPQKKQ
jgi:hypothetical protein